MGPEVTTAIIAAGSALLGGLISGFASALMPLIERRQRHREHLRERFEHCAELVNQTLEWAATLQSVRTTEQLLEQAAPMPARRLHVLALVYFPDLRSYSEQLLERCVDFQSVLASSFQASSPVAAGPQAAIADLQSYRAAAEALQRARLDLDTAISRHARKYTA